MNICTKCGGLYAKLISGSKRCQPCRTTAHKEYCARVGYHKKRYAKESLAERERHLVRKYGVTLAAYDQLLVVQGGVCAICKRTQNRAFDVDHNHETGVVRGLLCTNCNRMVGHAHDSPDRLEAAADYLRQVVPQVAAEFVRAAVDSGHGS